jgi:polyisoprenoid-binding protein YceI
MTNTSRTNDNNRNWVRIIGIVVLIVVLLAGGGLAALILTGGSGEPSQAAADAAPTLENEETTGRTQYRIEPSGTTARFSIDEVLNNEDVTAVGTTNEVGGDFIVDFDTPAESEVGTILVNARTLETDNFFRNRALRSFILQSAQDEYEFIRFEPTELSGLPDDSVAPGDTLEFQITGDLTIVETTNEVTFDASVTVDEDGILTGQASTTVLYPDFNLTIPDVPNVASVEDEVLLEIEFTAVEVTGEVTPEPAEATDEVTGEVTPEPAEATDEVTDEVEPAATEDIDDA